MRVRLVSWTKLRLTATLMAAFALVMQPLYSVLSAQVANAATVTVVSGDTSERLFNRDVSTSTPYSFTTEHASTGYGSIYVAPISTNPSDKFIAENFVKTPISSLNSISYDFRVAGNGTAASANQFYLNIYATIDASDKYYDCRFDYVPTTGSMSSFTQATFNATDTPTSVTKRGVRIAACPATLADMPEGSHVRAFAVNVGGTSASDAGLAGYLDNVVVDKAGGVSTYDFERNLPNMSYVQPTNQNNMFRSSDNPVRVKIDDSATQQVTRVEFGIWTYDTATNSEVAHVKDVNVNRAQCSTAATYVLCDINKSDTWSILSEGSYVVKPTVYINNEETIRTKMGEYRSHPFTIDNTSPTVGSLMLENPVSGITNTTNVVVAATASDASGVESVNFYVTEPRAADGVCTGNGTKLVESRVSTADGDGKYRVTLDTAALEGEYCITAVARDDAKNNSAGRHVKVVVDRTAPTLTMLAPANGEVFGGIGKKEIVVTSQLFDAHGLGQYHIDIDGSVAPTATTSDMAVSSSPVGLTVIAIFNAADFSNGEHTINVWVTDKAGNMTQESRTIWVNNTVVVPGGSGSIGSGSATTDDADRSLLDQVARLNQPFVVPSVFGAATPQTADANAQVLGTDEANDVTSGAQTVAAVPTEEGWKIFGTAWYWWVLLAAILGVSTAWLVRRAKHRAAQNL